MLQHADPSLIALQARVAELERQLAARGKHEPMRPRFLRSLLIIGLALALVVPAGVVLASHSFSDVPTNHKFHADIAAIAAAGITTGCAADRYCPDGLVTRGQMAAFLNRLGALGPGKAPKVNADKVDGVDASGFLRTNRLTSATVLLSSPPDTLIVRDSRTGAEVLLHDSLPSLLIVNTGSSQMQVAGTATGALGGYAEAMFTELAPGESTNIGAGAYLDLAIVVAGTTASTTRTSHLTCSAADGAGGSQDVLTCLVTG